MNPIVYNDWDGVIKDQQIANLSIENADWAPIIACWIKEKNAYMCIYSTGNNDSERAGTYEEVTVIFKANSNHDNTPYKPRENRVTQCLHIRYLIVSLP